MKTKRYIHNDVECEYHVFGNGKRVLYCFHGFGGSMHDWSVFAPWLADAFTIYSFTDFFHGSTSFPVERIKKDPLTKTEVSERFESFAKDYSHDRISLMAFSSGGRIALTLIEMDKLKIEETWLFAADGLKISFWNRLFCNYSFVQRIYNNIVQNPEPFFRWVKIAVKVKLLSRDLAKFVLFSMRSEKKRQLIYYYWMFYRNIKPNKKNLARSINESDNKIHLIMGARDQVIPTKSAFTFARTLDKDIGILIVDDGHLLLSDELVSYYKKEFSFH